MTIWRQKPTTFFVIFISSGIEAIFAEKSKKASPKNPKKWVQNPKKRLPVRLQKLTFHSTFDQKSKCWSKVCFGIQIKFQCFRFVSFISCQSIMDFFSIFRRKICFWLISDFKYIKISVFVSFFNEIECLICRLINFHSAN